MKITSVGAAVARRRRGTVPSYGWAAGPPELPAPIISKESFMAELALSEQ